MSASLYKSFPRSEAGRSRHEGEFRADRAAATALSMSVVEAAWTETISDSFLLAIRILKWHKRCIGLT
jgi:hypothetical protein